MCDPVSLTIATAAVTMGGQYVQGQAAYTNAKYEQAAATSNAALARDQAKQSIETTQKEAAQRYRAESQLEGQQQAAMGANGIDTTFGSAVSVQRDDKMIANEDVGNIYTAGRNRTTGYLMDAYNYRERAAAAHSAAKAAGWATAFGMASTALGAATQVSKMRSAQNFGG